MNSFFETMGSFSLWILLSSLQAGLLVLLVLGVVGLLGRRMRPGWQYLLWMLVVVRMVLPWAPVSAYSVHNLLTPILPKGNINNELDLAAAPHTPSSTLDPAQDDVQIADHRSVGSGSQLHLASAGSPAAASGSQPSAYRTTWFWSCVWLIGAGMAGAMLLMNQFVLWRAVRGRRPVTDSATLDLLEECKERMGVTTLLAIVATDRIHTPALYGLLRPRLLVPSRMLTELPHEQVRHVFLHELAHLKRLDIHLGWVAAVVQVLHWFNPLVWLATAQLRVTRELACDQRVLDVLDRDESQAYGHTVLNLLQYWTPPRRIPGMAGILEERSQLKRRIKMIASQRARQGMGSVAALALAGGLALVGLTNGQTPPAASAGKATTSTRPAGPEVVVRYDDDKADGKLSVAGSGHGIEFQRPANAKFVEAVEIFASRYGRDEAPKEFFHVYILNQDRQVLADVPFAYGLIQKGEEKWYRLRTPSVEVSATFMIALAFDPQQTKGVFLSYANTDKPHSFLGLPAEGYEAVDKKYDWMVRAIMAESPSGQKGTKLLKDWKPTKKAGPFGSCVAIPAKADPSEEKQSYGGQGPAIEFTVDPGKIGSGKLSRDEIMVKGFSLYASRYGAGFDPKTTMVHVAVIDSAKEVRWHGDVPYAAFPVKPQWVNVVLPEPLSLSDLAGDDNKLTFAVDPEAQQTRGIFFHYQKSPEQSHSLAGTIDRGFKPVNDREWLMRVHVEPKLAAKAGGPS